MNKKYLLKIWRKLTKYLQSNVVGSLVVVITCFAFVWILSIEQCNFVLGFLSGETSALIALSAIIVWGIFILFKSKSNFKLSYLLPLFVFIVIVLWLFIAQYRVVDIGKCNHGEVKPQYDEFIYYLLTGVGVIVTFLAFLIQYFANRQQASKLEETQEINKRGAFEGRYFNAITTFREFVRFQKLRGVGEGQDVFRYMYWEYKALETIVKKVDNKIESHIVFTIFLLGVTLEGSNGKIKAYVKKCGKAHLIDVIFEKIYEIQRSNDEGEEYLTERIAEGKFDYIKDYAKASIWYKEKVMWYDGHKHRLLQFIKLRNYILSLLEKDEFFTINQATVGNNDKFFHTQEGVSGEKKKYYEYLEALMSEYEIELINSFENWLTNMPKDTDLSNILGVDPNQYKTPNWEKA